MVVLDLTVMNIALPSAQRALHFTTVDRQWVVTAYTLAFGSLLLPGGRLADLLGRKATFLAGLAGFDGRHLRLRRRHRRRPAPPRATGSAGHARSGP
jgi:MFS family permease